MTVISRCLGVSRSNLYAQRRRRQAIQNDNGDAKQSADKDDDLVQRIKTILTTRPTYGYRRITAILCRTSQCVINHKKVYRVMNKASLLLQRHTGKRQRTHQGKVITLRRNTGWCTDAFGIQCWTKGQLQVAFSMDCCDREVISWVTSTCGIDGELVRDLMTETLEQRYPQARRCPQTIQWLSDNGPGYTARQTVFHGRLLGLEVCTTPSYSPQSNGMAEAFVKTFKRDYVYVNDLSSAQTVREQLFAWFDDYNNYAPHKGLQMRSPRQYLAAEKVSN